MESAFAVIAEPNRRAILGLLLSSDRSVGELERDLQLSQPSVSKHLRVLRDAGLVESRIEAQRRLYRLSPAPLKELDEWLIPFRRFWSKHVDALERHLETMEDPVSDTPAVASVLRQEPPKAKSNRVGRSRTRTRSRSNRMKGRKRP
jgi:DNA-binding transcriptional ArsR family regulator